jgi:hypothetical protein
MIAYLASPYSDSNPEVVAHRMIVFGRVDAELMSRGIHTVSPLLKHFVLHHCALPNSWAYWQEYSEKLMRLVDQLIVICQPGWKESVGTQAEIELALELGIPIIYVNEVGSILGQVDGQLSNGVLPSSNKTMDETYGDGSPHECCLECGLCVTCGDCQCITPDMFTRNGEGHEAAMSLNDATPAQLEQRKIMEDVIRQEIDNELIQQILAIAKEKGIK